jgi:type IV pilus assembly protein PilC
MPEFMCRLGTPGGDVVTRVIEAEGVEQLRKRLQSEGFRIFALDDPNGSLLTRTTFGGNTVKPEEFLLFNQQFAALLRAGLPMLQAVGVLVRRQKPGAFRVTLEDIERRIRGGAALSEAFEQHPKVFPRLLTASVLAGERSGELDKVLQRYVAQAKVTAEVRRKLTKTLTYPIILIVASTLLVTLLTTYVIPKFATLYESSGSELPQVTLVVVGFSKFVEGNLAWLLPVLIVGAVGFFLWRRTERGKRSLDLLLLRLPVVGDLIRQGTTARLARSAATLLGGGLTLLEALEIASEVIGNRGIGETMPSVMREIREGQPLTESLERAGWLPAMALDMIGVGEKSGSLGTMLEEVAEFYDAELDVRISSLTALIEPVVLGVMGAIVLTVVLALYLPILQFVADGNGHR